MKIPDLIFKNKDGSKTVQRFESKKIKSSKGNVITVGCPHIRITTRKLYNKYTSKKNNEKQNTNYDYGLHKS